MKLGLYGVLSRMWRKSSYSVKLLLVAVLGMHTMLGSAVVMILPPNLDPRFVLAVIAIERALTFALTIWLFWSLLTPVRATVTFLEEYLRTGKITHLPTDYSDEVGRLMADTHLVVTQLDKAVAELARTSTTDAMTGLPNRRFAAQRLALDAEGLRSERRQAIIAMIDLDDLKLTNDTRGHPAGDECLTKLGHALQAVAGERDWVARWGGDEYLALFWDADENIVTRRLEAVREVLAKEGISFSDGLAELTTEVHVSLERADVALYAAKRGGKGQGSIAPSTNLALDDFLVADVPDGIQIR